MLESDLEPERYTIDYDCPIPWPAEGESKVGADYPFTDYVEETLEEYIIQRYLETLWLPDSITCLAGFIRNLRRIRIRPDMDPRHLFKPLLLSVEAIREKYHVQLPRVLKEECADGDGEEGIEETMMWFAYGNEKHLRDVSGLEGSEAAEQEWLTKMEYREMKIQILLCFHILSLQKQKGMEDTDNKSKLPAVPSTPTKKQTEASTKLPAIRSSLSPTKHVFPPTESMSIHRERGKKRPETDAAFSKDKPAKALPIDIEERLELLMDRLSIAQLMANLQTSVPTLAGSSQPSTSAAVAASSAQVSSDTTRDWMQVFCEDIVKPLFHESLPTFYNLLHSKVFSHSPFSDESDNTAPSPILRPQRKFAAKERRQPPSPLKLHEVAKQRGTLSRTASAIITGSGSTPTSTRGSIVGNQGQVQQLSVSSHPHQSRSVSVSVEEVRARGASRGGVASSKALFQGEFEMKRSLSKSGKLFQSGATLAKAKIEAQASHSQGSLSKSQPITRIRKETRAKATAKTLVFDTPVKKLFPSPLVSGPSAFMDERRDNLNMKERPEFVTGDDFEWSSEEDSHANSNFANSDPTGRTEPQIFVMDTPVKSRG